MHAKLVGSLSANPFALGGIQPGPWKPQPFMPVSSEVYSEIQQFLIYEALLLDHGCVDRWAQLLANDITYSVRNCSGQDCRGEDPAEYVDKGRDALLARVSGRRQETPGENRLPQTRRFVTNVSVSFAHCRKQYDVVSYLRVARIGHDGTTNSAWSAERRERLYVIERSLRIACREVLIDSIEPGMSAFPQFL